MSNIYIEKLSELELAKYKPILLKQVKRLVEYLQLEEEMIISKSQT